MMVIQSLESLELVFMGYLLRQFVDGQNPLSNPMIFCRSTGIPLVTLVQDFETIHSMYRYTNH